MKIIISLFLSSMSIYACYSPRYVYGPPTQNIPLINKQNKLEFAAFYAGSANPFKAKDNYHHGFDLHTALATGKHFGIMLNESVRWEKNGDNESFFQNDSSFLTYKRNFIEAGAGYFTAVENNKKMQFQVFGGTAFGSSKISDDFISNSVQVNKYHYSRVTKIFIQPAFIYSPSKNVSAALASRLTEVLFTHIRTNYTSTELDNYVLDSISVSPVFFWEPAVCYTFGFRNFPVKFRLQGSISVLLNHRFVEYRSSNIGLGLVSNFSKKQRNKPAAPK